MLEAYSGAAIFVHSLSSPMSEREYTHKLFKYLLMRTERGVAAYGEPPALSISHLSVLFLAHLKENPKLIIPLNESFPALSCLSFEVIFI